MESAAFSPSHASLTSIAELLRSRAGLSYGPGRLAGLEAGIGRAQGRSGVADLEAYARALEAEEPRGGQLLDDLLVEVTVGETYFFREPQQFDFLRREVLPDLARQRRDGPPLRVWSAGCATGEEPYSLAILLEEEDLAGRARILATDVCRTAISKAREGEYGKWSLRGSDEAFTGRYFARQHDRFRLDPRLRELVTFKYLNLAFDGYPSFAFDVWGMDLILCRNVLIYFDEATIQRVAQCLLATLSKGGWLITGPSDPPLSGHAPFETVVTKAGVFYRRGLPEEAPAVSSFSPPSAAPTSQASAPPRSRKLTTPAARSGKGVHANLTPLIGHPPRLSPVRSLEPPPDGPATCVLRVKALANTSGAELATDAAARDAVRFPLSAELHFLHAVLLISLDRDEEAARALRRVLYLDRSLAVAHFVLGSLLTRRGDAGGALAAYRNARNLAAGTPLGELLPLSDGEPAGRLAEAAAAQLALLEPTAEVAR